MAITSDEMEITRNRGQGMVEGSTRMLWIREGVLGRLRHNIRA